MTNSIQPQPQPINPAPGASSPPPPAITIKSLSPQGLLQLSNGKCYQIELWSGSAQGPNHKDVTRVLLSNDDVKQRVTSLVNSLFTQELNAARFETVTVSKGQFSLDSANQNQRFKDLSAETKGTFDVLSALAQQKIQEARLSPTQENQQPPKRTSVTVKPEEFANEASAPLQVQVAVQEPGEPNEITLPDQHKQQSAKQATKALGLISQLKVLAADGSRQVAFQGKQYSIPQIDRYGVRTWELEIEGKSYQINEFSKDAYHGVKTEGFHKRQELLKEAARRCIEENVSDPQRKQVLKVLNQLDEDVHHAIETECQINPEEIKSNPEKIEYYEEIHKKALGLLAQFAKDTEYLIKQASPNGFKLSELEKAEREHVVERGRPVIINTFFSPGEGGALKQFVSMQTPAARTFDDEGNRVEGPTIPSTLRDREGLVNYVVSAFGEVTPDAANAPQVQILFEGIRHSSYPAIAIKDEQKRIAIACGNCRQGLTDIAERLIGEGEFPETSQEKPLKVSLRTMMLLTAKQLDFVRNKKKKVAGTWTGESETTQLEDSVAALSLFRDRTIKIMIGEKPLWIRPDMSFMNLGTNAAAASVGALGKAPEPKIHEQINARGILEFNQETSNFLEDRLTPLLNAMPPEFQSLATSLLGEWKGMQKLEDSATIQLLKGRLEAVKNENREVLEVNYAKLEQLYKAVLEHPDSAETKQEIAKINKAIKACEKKIYGACQQLQAEQKKQFLANQEAIIEKQQALEKHLNALAGCFDKSDPRSKELFLLRDIAVNAFEARSAFYNELHKKADTVMVVQTAYITTHSLMKNPVEFFCKSAEDRTGREDDKIQEREVYRSLFGKYPTTEEEMNHVNENIAPLVHQYSASQNNTEQNSNARGEQIGQNVNTEIDAKLDKEHASLAKKVFKKAKKLKPSPQVQQYCQELRV